MRNDMPKLMLERPRVNHGYRICKGRKKQAQGNPESLPLREPIKRRWDFHCRQTGKRLVGREDHRKQFSDYFAPVIRFLSSRTGRTWDDVYSEIRKETSPSTAVGFHLIHHVRGLVKRSVYMVGGAPHSMRHRKLGSKEFFVHPESQLLCRVE